MVILALVCANVDTHKHGKGNSVWLFLFPDVENVSAVLFAASGMFAKFNRIGRLAGFGDASIPLIADDDGTCMG